MSNGVIITLIICVTLVIINYNNKSGVKKARNGRLKE